MRFFIFYKYNFPKKFDNQRGFTLIELLIATSIFTVIVLVATAGIISLGRLYYKGITQAEIQDITRNISDEISRSVQFANGVKTLDDTVTQTQNKQVFCLGTIKYTVNIDAKYSTGSNDKDTGLWAEDIDSGDTCTGSTSSSNLRQLLGNNMRLLNFEVAEIGNTNSDGWRVNMRIASGDNDLLSHYDNNGDPISGASSVDAVCKSGIAGSSFCAVAQLDTVVKKRLN